MPPKIPALKGQPLPAWEGLTPPQKIFVGIVLVLTVTLMVLDFFIPQHHQWFEFVALLSAGSGAVIAAVYAAAALTVALQRESRRDDINKKRKADTILRDQTGRHFDKVLYVIENGAMSTTSQSIDWQLEVKKDPSLHPMIYPVLRSFEDMAVNINSGRADEEILYRTNSSLLSLHLTRLESFIDTVQASRDRRGTPQGKDFMRQARGLNEKWKMHLFSNGDSIPEEMRT
jgi:hypothetical protein